MNPNDPNDPQPELLPPPQPPPLPPPEPPASQPVPVLTPPAVVDSQPIPTIPPVSIAPVASVAPVAPEKKLEPPRPLDPAHVAIYSPLFRNAIHGGAFLLFFVPFGMLVDPRHNLQLGQTVVVAFMVFVTLFNMFVLQRLESGKRITRPGEGFVSGLWLYPLALAICFWALPPFAAMAAWAAMAAGDAAASLVGRVFSIPKLAWNKKKSWAGTLAFVAAAIPCCWMAMYICPSGQFLKSDGSPELPFLWTLSVLAAVAGALLESIESRVDDNLRVPLGVGAFMSIVGMFLSWSTREQGPNSHVQPEKLLWALGYNAVLGGAVLALGFADVLGTALGVTFGVIIYFYAHWQGFLLFLMFVGIGCGLSRIGYKHKQLIGAAEANSGTRGVGNVAANLIVPVLCCLLYIVCGHAPAFMMAYAGSIAAAFADTASSEIGSLGRGQAILITTRKSVPHGTNGGVTLLGFLASIAAIALLVTVAKASGFFEEVVAEKALTAWQHVALIGTLVFAGLCGTIVDSYLGATVEGRVPFVGKGVVNFSCTLVGAAVAGVLALLWF